MILYRLTLPGGLLLAVCFALIRFGILNDRQTNAALIFFPAAVFVAGLVLSAVFRRSRLFFGLLTLALAQAALAWTVPNISNQSRRVLADAAAILVPLHLLAIAFFKERGIISPACRNRRTCAGCQDIVVTILCLPALAKATSAW